MIWPHQTVYFLVFFLSLISFKSFGTCTLKTTYKELAKYPYIEKAPSNEGILKDFYQEVGKIIKCKIEFLRMPKNVGWTKLQEGTIDFYPRTTITDLRKEFLYFFRNGMAKKSFQWGITNKEVPDLFSYTDVSENDLRVLIERGSSKLPSLLEQNIPLYVSDVVGVESFFKLLKFDDRLFYEADRELLKSYLRKNSSDLRAIKIHKNFSVPKIKTYYVGFAKNSPHITFRKGNIKEQQDFEDDSIDKNLDPNCLAYKFFKAILEIRKSGKVKDWLEKYRTDENYQFYFVP